MHLFGIACGLIGCHSALIDYWSFEKCSHTPASSELFPSVLGHPVALFTSSNSNSLPSIMSQICSTAASSSRFQLIINDALKIYNKRTKNDLLLHPLATELQGCESPTNILAVLQQQIQGIDRSRDGDDRWTKWLDPTINVLLTFSQTAGTVGLVCPRMRLSEICTLMFIWQAFSPATVVFAGIGILLSVRILINLAWVILTYTVLRQLRTFVRAMKLFWISSSASRCFFDGLRCTLNWR